MRQSKIGGIVCSAIAATFFLAVYSPIATAQEPGKCNLSTVVGTLLGKDGNEPVQDLYGDIKKLTPRRLEALRASRNFYPPEGNKERERLVKRFEDGVGKQQFAFEDFLADLVGARDPACEACRYLDQWTLVKQADYPNVTPTQLRWLASFDYNSIAIDLKNRGLCAQLPTEDERNACVSRYTQRINDSLGNIRTEYGEAGFEGGAQFKARMELYNRKTHCYKQTNEPLGP